MAALKTYPGSCHCGNIKYLVKLSLPPQKGAHPFDQKPKIYKCNCTTCHKMGLFHVRPVNPGDQFLLLSPDPSELGEYRCFSKNHAWHFCKTCGVRTFALGGHWVETEVDVGEWEGKASGDGTKRKVWKTKGKKTTVIEDGKEVENIGFYLSINAVTLEPGEDVDLPKWKDNGWVYYIDLLSMDAGHPGEPEARYDEPYFGGMY